MNEELQNHWNNLSKNSDQHSINLLQNLTIKQIEFNNQNNGKIKEVKNVRPTLPTKIVYNGYQALQMKKNKRMLPGLPLKPINMLKGNNQESKIKDRKSEILKTDPDRAVHSESKNQRFRTSPNDINQFIQSRDISSVKNSRGPKIIANQIMMLGNQKRMLVSQQKRRPKIQVEESYSLKKDQHYRVDPFQAMQMTFYNPAKVQLFENSGISVHLKKIPSGQSKRI